MRRLKWVHHHKPNVYQNGKDKQFYATCGKCGALLYVAKKPSTFKEVFPVERPYCFHCGSKVDSSDIETNPDRYCEGC